MSWCTATPPECAACWNWTLCRLQCRCSRGWNYRSAGQSSWPTPLLLIWASWGCCTSTTSQSQSRPQYLIKQKYGLLRLTIRLTIDNRLTITKCRCSETDLYDSRTHHKPCCYSRMCRTHSPRYTVHCFDTVKKHWDTVLYNFFLFPAPRWLSPPGPEGHRSSVALGDTPGTVSGWSSLHLLQKKKIKSVISVVLNLNKTLAKSTYRLKEVA